MKLSGKALILAGEFFLIVSMITFNLVLKSPSSTAVLSEQTAIAMATPKATPNPIQTEAPKVAVRTESFEENTTPTPPPLTKSSYVIAFIGDSMTETMGGALPYVYKELKKKYPNTEFSLYNYGIGAENVIEAISRFDLPYSYKDQGHEPITKLGADIIIVGSYGYNPITPFDKNEQWLLLSDLVNRAKSVSREVYVLAEQAPIKENFGKGIGGVNWPSEISDPHVDKIVSGIENAVGISEALNVGLINVFEKSKIKGTSYGNPLYVANHDGIHYSEEGQQFSAKVIAESIDLE
jgi:hypothetical protein